MPDKKPAALFIESGEYDRLLQGMSIAATAAHLEREVLVFFFFKALEKLVQGRLDGEDEASVAPGGGDHPAPSALLQSARETGRCHLYACSASTKLLGLTPAQVMEHVDEIVGWPTILRLTAGVTDRFSL